MEGVIVISFIIGLILLYIIGKVFIIPYKFIFKFIINGILGGILLGLLNYFAGSLGITIPINPITALLAGFLGIPGVILLIIVQFLVF